MSRILLPDEVDVRAQASVTLLSRVQRPYLFRVRVEGQYPHNRVREYDIAAVNEAAAAFKGIEVFSKQMSKRVQVRELIMDSIRPGGR
jgi:hypothetical protein